MKDKLKNLYTNNFEDFVKLLKLFYGVDDIMAVLQDYYKKNDFYFIIDGRLLNFETVVEDMSETANKLKLFKQFKLI
jgi:hypothetical protein